MHSLVLGVQNDENDKKRKEKNKQKGFVFLYKLIEINDSVCVWRTLDESKKRDLLA